MKAKDANMRFLFGSVLFFFVLLMVIMLFSYFTLQQSLVTDDAKLSTERYEISFSKQFDGTTYDLYLNDSLLYVGNPVDVDTVIRASGRVQDNALLIVEKSSDIATIINIEPRGKVLICYGRNGEVTVDVTE